MVVVSDLEGVLVPEIWAEIARATGVEDLAATTHDEPDFDRLMALRIELLQRHDLRLPELQRVAADVLPFPGATEILSWIRTKGQVMIASDSFHELSETIVQRMGGYALFANTFRVDDAGRVLGYRLRIRGRKDKVIRSLKEIGFHIIAIGDGYNDERMFRVADDAILFRAPDDLAARIPDGHRISGYDELRKIVLDVHRRLARSHHEYAR
jgi:phosphoserine/homoserine phosphotransferase